MDPFTMGALVMQGVKGATDLVSGAINEGKANRDARKNVRPTYYIPKPVFDNQGIAETRASRGISDATFQGLQTQRARSNSAALNSILMNGGDLNHIGDIVTADENGNTQLGMIDDEMRSRNAQGLINQNNEMAGYLDKDWTINKYAPYADKQQEIAQRRAAAQKQQQAGANTLVSAGANAATANMYEKEINGLFQMGGADPTATYTPHIEAARALGQLDQYLGPSAPSRTNVVNSAPPSVGQQLQSKFPGLIYGSSFTKY